MPATGDATALAPSSWAVTSTGVMAHLRSSGAQVPAVNPVHNKAAIFLRRLLPCKVTGIEGVNLAVGHKLVDVLVVRPWNEIVVPACDDLGRRGDCWQQLTQNRVELRVVPDKPSRLGETSEVVGADVILVDLRLCIARGGGFNRVADVGSRIERAHDVQAGRLDDVFEGAAGVDRKTNRT